MFTNEFNFCFVNYWPLFVDCVAQVEFYLHFYCKYFKCLSVSGDINEKYSYLSLLFFSFFFRMMYFSIKSNVYLVTY